MSKGYTRHQRTLVGFHFMEEARTKPHNLISTATILALLLSPQKINLETEASNGD